MKQDGSWLIYLVIGVVCVLLAVVCAVVSNHRRDAAGIGGRTPGRPGGLRMAAGGGMCALAGVALLSLSVVVVHDNSKVRSASDQQPAGGVVATSGPTSPSTIPPGTGGLPASLPATLPDADNVVFQDDAKHLQAANNLSKGLENSEKNAVTGVRSGLYAKAGSNSTYLGIEYGKLRVTAPAKAFVDAAMEGAQTTGTITVPTQLGTLECGLGQSGSVCVWSDGSRFMLVLFTDDMTSASAGKLANGVITDLLQAS
jgi:hypothetical protein